MKSSRTDTFRIDGAVLSYPHLFKAEQVNGQGDPKFSGALLVPAEAATDIYNKAMALAQSHFKNGEFNNPDFRWPVLAANTKPNYAGNPRLAPLYIVNAKASEDYPPQILDGTRRGVDGKPVVVTEADRTYVYAGCMVSAGIVLYTYQTMGQGIAVGLSAIMKSGEGESLGGEGVDTDALFSGVEVQATAPGASMPGGAPAANPFGQPAPTASAEGMPKPPFM